MDQDRTGCIRTRTRITAEPIKDIRCSLPTIVEEKKDIKKDKVFTKKEHWYKRLYFKVYILY